MKKYLNYKHTSWSRLYFKENTDMSKIIDKLEQGYLLAELCGEEEFERFESLDDTEEYTTPSENENRPTIEIFEDNHIEHAKNIWNNVNKFN